MNNEEFEILQDFVSELEKRVAKLRCDLQANVSLTNSCTNDIAQINKQLLTLNKSVSALDARLQALESTIVK